MCDGGCGEDKWREDRIEFPTQVYKRSSKTKVIKFLVSQTILGFSTMQASDYFSAMNII